MSVSSGGDGALAACAVRDNNHNRPASNQCRSHPIPCNSPLALRCIMHDRSQSCTRTTFTTFTLERLLPHSWNQAGAAAPRQEIPHTTRVLPACTAFDQKSLMEPSLPSLAMRR
jgi:hypothetical protein